MLLAERLQQKSEVGHHQLVLLGPSQAALREPGPRTENLIEELLCLALGGRSRSQVLACKLQEEVLLRRHHRRGMLLGRNQNSLMLLLAAAARNYCFTACCGRMLWARGPGRVLDLLQSSIQRGTQM